MANPISTYMMDWLNTTYAYLKETGGPLKPPVTTGPGVLPTGAYTRVEDLPGGYYSTPAAPLPLPFNPRNTGLAPLNENKNDTNAEIARENPAPVVISGGFEGLYGAVGMKGCLSDQIDGRGNPLGQKACENFAATGDTSLMIFFPRQKEFLGLTTVENRDKPDDAQAAENDLSLTDQLAQGGKKIVDSVNAWLPGGGGAYDIPPPRYVTGDDLPSGGGEGDEGTVFKNIEKAGDWLKGLIPEAPGVNTGSIIMIGGSIVLVVLIIAVLK